MFDNDFTTFTTDFDNEPVSGTIKNPQANAPVEWVHQVILNMIITKYLAHKVFNYIDQWGDTLEYI